MRKPVTIGPHAETGNHWTFQRDLRVAAWARGKGIEWHQSRQFGVVRGLRQRQHWAAQWERLMAKPQHVISHVRSAPCIPADPIPDAPPTLAARSTPGAQQRAGRNAGLRCLETFLYQRGEHYTVQMSSPVTAGGACSRVSTHLASCPPIWLGAPSRCVKSCRQRAIARQRPSHFPPSCVVHGHARCAVTSPDCIGIVTSCRNSKQSLRSSSAMSTPRSMACANRISRCSGSMRGEAARRAGPLSTPACAH